MNTIIFGSNPEPYVGVGEHGLQVAGDNTVSDAHCRITQCDDGSFTIADLGSLNGTFIIDPHFGRRNPLAAHRGSVPRRVIGIMPLPKGARVRIGQTTLPWVVDR